MDDSPVATMSVTAAAIAGFLLAAANGTYTLYGAWREAVRGVTVVPISYQPFQVVWVPKSLLQNFTSPWEANDVRPIAGMSQFDLKTGKQLFFPIEERGGLIKAHAWPMRLRFSNDTKANQTIVRCALSHVIGELREMSVRSFSYQEGAFDKSSGVKYNQPVVSLSPGGTKDIELTFFTLISKDDGFVDPAIQSLELECEDQSSSVRTTSLVSRKVNINELKK